MSSYPPPPPPPPGSPPPPYGQYPPPYDRYTLRAQRRAMREQARFQKAQQRAQQQQWRAQRRIVRRGSIVGPLIILSIGVVFLLDQIGRPSWAQTFRWFGLWWPAILIAVGVILLIEWAVDQRGNAATGPRIGGGVVFLLVLLALAGLSSRAVEYGLGWRDHTFGDQYANLDTLFGDRHSADSSINHGLPAKSAVVIRDPHGDVTVSGSSSDGQVHVNVHTETYGWKDSEARKKARELEPTFSSDNGILTLNVNAVDGGEADLTVAIPRNTPVTIQGDHGDITVSEMSAPVTVSANHGDVDVSGVDNNVTLHVNDADASVTIHSVKGIVSVEGHSGDIDISDITGALTLQGDFFGSTDLEHIDGAVRFDTSRTQFSAMRLDDEFSVDNDSLDASQVLGPVMLKTQDKNITLDRIQGSVDVSNRNGPIEMTSAAPLAAISIHNQHGSVDLGLPGKVGFDLNAETRNGDMENDFDLTQEGSNEHHTLQGQVAGGGPTVTIATTDGDVTVRQSSVTPLPQTPPPPARITTTPPVPRLPRVPKAPRGITTTPPKAPNPPQPPSQDGTF